MNISAQFSARGLIFCDLKCNKMYKIQKSSRTIKWLRRVFPVWSYSHSIERRVNAM